MKQQFFPSSLFSFLPNIYFISIIFHLPLFLLISYWMVLLFIFVGLRVVLLFCRLIVDLFQDLESTCMYRKWRQRKKKWYIFSLFIIPFLPIIYFISIILDVSLLLLISYLVLLSIFVGLRVFPLFCRFLVDFLGFNINKYG